MTIYTSAPIYPVHHRHDDGHFTRTIPVEVVQAMLKAAHEIEEAAA